MLFIPTLHQIFDDVILKHEFKTIWVNVYLLYLQLNKQYSMWHSLELTFITAISAIEIFESCPEEN